MKILSLKWALDTNMGKKRDLNDADRLKIWSMLGYGKSTLEIAKNMNRLTRFMVSGQTTRKTLKRRHLRRHLQIKGCGGQGTPCNE